METFCSLSLSNSIITLCKYIIDTSNYLKNISNQRFLKKFCINSGTCILDHSEELTGTRCLNCIWLTNQILLHEKKDRLKAFYSFCSTSRFLTSTLCGDIIDDGINEFLLDLESVTEGISVGISSHFCRYKKNLNSLEDL